jgi:hypothetical protein
VLFRTIPCDAPEWRKGRATGMKLEDPSRIVCDGCGLAEADTEEDAAASGWLIDYSTDPHSHICPACQRASLGR